MSVFNYNDIKINNHTSQERQLLIYIIQIVTLYNASIRGWKIKRIGTRKYMLSKHINKFNKFNNFRLDKFIYDIVDLKLERV